MNRLIDGAVQLLDEAGKRNSQPKTYKNYGKRTLQRIDFNDPRYKDDPHYKAWDEAAQDHPDFFHYETNTRKDDNGLLVTTRHAVDEFGNILGVYRMFHPTGSFGSIDPET